MACYRPNKTIYTFLICCLLLAATTLLGSTTISSIPIPPNISELSIKTNVNWVIDSSNQWTYDIAKAKTFQPHDFVEDFTFNPHHAYWFQFSLENTSYTDTLSILLCTGNYSKIELYTLYQKPLQGGNSLSFQDRAFRPNAQCLPIKIPPTKTQPYHLKLYHFYKKFVKPLPLRLKSYEQEQVEI